MELASLLLLVTFVAKQLKSPKGLKIIQNPKLENKIFGQFERSIQRIDQLASTDKELKAKLNIQMKFLTALGIRFDIYRALIAGDCGFRHLRVALISPKNEASLSRI